MSEQRDKMKTVADRMSAAVRSYVARALDGRIGPLEARIAALESKVGAPQPNTGERTNDDERSGA